MLPIQVPILFHSDETHTLKSVGIDYDFNECEVRPMTFYNINAISPYLEDGIQYTSIHANGSEYICTHSYEDMREIINKLTIK